LKTRCCSKIPTSGGTLQNLKAFTVSWGALMGRLEPDFAALKARHLGLPHDVLQKGGPARNLREPGICVCMET